MGSKMRDGLVWIDYLLILLYLMGTVGLGFFHRRQKTTAEYYLANRKAPGYLTGISVSITLFSAISLMGSVAIYFEKNLALLAGVLAIPFGVPVLTRIILPFYHNLPITTGYEYLQLRFNRAVRNIASILFVSLRLFYLAVVIYTPSVALAIVTGLPIFQNVLVMGFISLILACLGGMKGVIWAELVKFSVLVVSLISILLVLYIQIDGGILGAWETARAGGRLQVFDLSPELTVTFSFWWIFIGSFFQNLSSGGADQITIQRYLTSRSLKESRKAVVFQAWSVLPINGLIAVIAVGIYAFYQQHPHLLRDLRSPDYILPYFAVHQLPAGVSGLVLATIFAMALTTHSSGVHSVNTVVMNDLLVNFVGKTRKGLSEVRVARMGAVFWGVLTTVLALEIPRLGIIIIASQKVAQFFGGVLLGILLLGMVSRRATSEGVLVGILAGISCVAIVSVFTHVSYLLYGPLGCIVTMSVGYLASLFNPARRPDEIEGLCLQR